MRPLFLVSAALVAAAASGCGGGGGGALDCPAAPQTCDTDVWETMKMRANLETEREIMQNQNLIFKPDSILAYTCFDKFAEHAAQYGGSLFTHTKYWGGKEIIPWGAPYGMDEAMKNVVEKSMKTYMDSNFPYTMLGGRGEFLGAGGGGGGGQGGMGAANGMGKYDTSQAGKGDYACNVMNAVWKAAKCMNFVHNDNFKDTDGFYPFINLAGFQGSPNVSGYEKIGDTRAFPAALKCSSTAPVAGDTWDKAYRKSRDETSFGVMNFYYDFSTPLGTAFKDVRKKVEPGECDTPILTGVTVIESPSSGSEKYADGVCTNPGCVFVKNGEEGRCELSSGTVANSSGSPDDRDAD